MLIYFTKYRHEFIILIFSFLSQKLCLLKRPLEFGFISESVPRDRPLQMSNTFICRQTNNQQHSTYFCYFCDSVLGSRSLWGPRQWWKALRGSGTRPLSSLIQDLDWQLLNKQTASSGSGGWFGRDVVRGQASPGWVWGQIHKMFRLTTKNKKTRTPPPRPSQPVTPPWDPW